MCRRACEALVKGGHITTTPSWDLVITLIFVIGVSYGFIMLRDRILVFLLSLYCGIVVANTLSNPLQKFMNGDVPLLNKVWIDGHASTFTLKVVLFLATVLLVGAKSGLAGKRAQLSLLETGLYSIFNVCIGLSSIFSFMEPAQQETFTHASKLAALVMSHQSLWLIAPLLVLAFLGGGGSRAGSYPPDY